MFNDCLKFYLDSMHTAFDNVEASYFSETDLEKVHINMKDGALLKVIATNNTNIIVSCAVTHFSCSQNFHPSF